MADSAPVAIAREFETFAGSAMTFKEGRIEVDGVVAYRLPTVPVQFDGRPPDLRRAPEHGEHTEAILTELGYDWDRIGQLADEGVIP